MIQPSYSLDSLKDACVYGSHKTCNEFLKKSLMLQIQIKIYHEYFDLLL